MVRLKALGQSAIEVGDVRIGPEQPYLFAIALYLIVERGKRISRQALVDLIWPNVKDEKHARQRFRQALLRLRESGLPIAGENGTLLLDKTAASTDFDTLASPAAIQIGQSLEFLPHYAPRISDRFLDWVETQRSRVHATVQRQFVARMHQARGRSDWAEVDELATECLRLDPYNEEAVMAHAECAVMRGSKREALSILDNYMEALGSHVGTIGLPAKILRTRIAERLTDQRYAMISEQHFVGRESSMELLQGLLCEAQRGAGSAAFIWGEPGIGKSRLVQEVTQLAALDGAQVVSTKCHPTDAGRPLSAFADLVPMLKTLPGALGCSAQTLALLQRLTDRNKCDAFPPQEAGDAAFLAATIRRAVFDLVDAVADEGMLVMVIEDVHWLDEPSWAILSAMVEWSTTRTLLTLLTSRTAHATEAKAADPDRGFHRHHLLPLREVDSTALLDRLTDDNANPLPESMCAWSVSSAEGNPYYLRELVRHWVETQQSFGVPKSLAELIEARLNRLSSLALRALQLCAVFGKHSSFERLEKATGYQNYVLLDAIEELSNGGMLAANGTGVAVKHDLLAVAALQRLCPAASKLVHRQVATVLEAEINARHPVVIMWDCAEHWQSAGETMRALDLARHCARYLHSVGEVHKSIELSERALQLSLAKHERLETLLALLEALRAAESWVRLEMILVEATSLAENPLLRDRLQLLRLEVEWRLGKVLQSQIPVLLEFATDSAKDASHRLQAIHQGLIHCSEEGRRSEAQSFFTLVESIPVSESHEALLSHIRMIFHSDFGNLDSALAHAEDLLAIETRIGEPGSLVRAHSNVAYCFRRSGRMTEARQLLVDSWGFALGHDLRAAAAVSAGRLALNAVQDEDFASAEIWHNHALTYAAALHEKLRASSLHYVKARIGLNRGDPQPAEAFLRAFDVVSQEMKLNVRHRETVCSMRCQLSLVRKEPIDRSTLGSLSADFGQYSDLGQHDFFAMTLYAALIAVGDQDRANRVLSAYVNHERTDRGPLPPSLAGAVAQLPSACSAD